jgi:hypothetical protein
MAPYLMNHYLRKYLIKGELGCSGRVGSSYSTSGSRIYNQKSENIDVKGLAEVINKLIFNNLHNPPPTKYCVMTS